MEGSAATTADTGSAADGGSGPTDLRDAAELASTAERAASQQWLRDSFAFRGLALMLDQPLRAIRAAALKLLLYLLFYVIVLAIFAAVVFVKGISDTASMVGQTDKITHHVNTWHEVVAYSTYFSVALALLVGLILISPSTYATVLEWSKVGNATAVMFGFVLLSFFSADSWHAAGALPWQRFISLLAVFGLGALVVLYRQGSRVVREALRAPISTAGIARSVKDPLVKQKIAEIDALPDTPQIPPHALANLRFIAAVLLGRRVLISGVIVAAAVFLLGVIVIGKQESLSLMNVSSAAGLGFTRSFGVGGYQFFLSETLLKVSLLLGLIAAGYFVFVSPDADKSQDLLVPTFVRRMIVLWVCYQRLAADMCQPEGSTPSSPHA